MSKAFRVLAVLLLALALHAGFGTGAATAETYWCSSPTPTDCYAEYQCCRNNCGPGELWTCTECKGLYMECMGRG